MTPLLILLAAALSPPQEACALESVEEKDGVYESAFACPWPKGTALRLEITRRTTHMSWAPKIEKDATGRDVERVSLAIQKRQRTVHRDTLKTDRNGGFTYSWKPKIPGVYHIQVVYDPGSQSAPNPRFPRENKTVHRLLALAPGQANGIVVDDARDALQYSKEFFRTLRAAIQKSNTDFELEAHMRPLIDEVLKRGEFTQHPGTYSLMEHLSPYVMSEPKDPKKTGPNDPRVMTPNKIDIKTANLPLAIVRESMVLAILMMEDAVQEAALLAPLPESTYPGIRRTAVERLALELPETVKGLQKLEPAGRLGYAFRATKFEQLLTESSAAVGGMLQKRSVDEPLVKDLLDRLNDAAKILGHPFESIKE
jgi:hypothetical protein